MAWSPPARQRRSWLVEQAGDYATFQFHHFRDGTDRHYGPALSFAASCHMNLDRANWAEQPETNRRKGIDLARQALQAGENDPGILANAAPRWRISARTSAP